MTTINGLLLLAVVVAALLGYLVGYLHTALHRPDLVGDVRQFHENFEIGYDGPPRVLPADLADFRAKFMAEELTEYNVADLELRELLAHPRPLIRKSGKIDQLLELQLDALVDLTYVVLGTAYLQFGQGVFQEAWGRVHAANMKKVRKLRAGDGHVDSGRAAQYDVVKPAGWVPPDHLDLIQLRHLPLDLGTFSAGSELG